MSEQSQFDFAVIGCGRMGASIAAQLALKGGTVAACDRSDFDRKKGYDIMRADMKQYIDKGFLLYSDRKAALERVTFVDSLKKAANAKLVIEAIFENLEAKQELFKNLDKEAENANAVFATNSINFDPSSCRASVENTDRIVCGVRFLYPVFFVHEVEISARAETLPEELKKVWDLLESYRFKPFYSQQRPGGSWRRKLDDSEIGKYMEEQRELTDKKGLELENSPPPVEKPKEGDMCVICLERPNDVVFSPCGHNEFCSECVNRLSRPKCPSCRRPIERVLPLD